MNWARLHLENVRMSERRYRLLLAYFPKANFGMTEVNRITKVDRIDNSLCPTPRCRGTGSPICLR